MRAMILLLALAGLSACNRTEEAAKAGPTESAKLAAVSYDGANATDEAARIEHGERLSWILGCKGCHGENLQGQNVTPDEPDLGDMWASNVTLRMAKYDDAAFAKFLREGDTHDGRALVFMPTESLQFLSDADVAALTAYLRTLPPAGKETPPVRLGKLWTDPATRNEFVPAKVGAKRFREHSLYPAGQQPTLGQYIAQTVCTECHNAQLEGYPEFSPDLSIVGTYNDAELMHMLTTGEGKVKKDLGLMSQVALHRTAKMTQHEREELIDYLRERVERAHTGERD